MKIKENGIIIKIFNKRYVYNENNNYFTNNNMFYNSKIKIEIIILCMLL